VPTSRRSQQERARTTRTALTEAARTLFATRGYPNVPADDIVRAAGVTRGALYHHHTDKQELFREVFEKLEQEVTDEVAQVARDAPDQWTGMVAALARFLELCQRPDVLRIALTDAPAVLGWQAWREIESRHGLGLITELLDAAVAADLLVPTPVPVLAQLVLSLVIEAALTIAHADDPAAAREQTQQALLVLFSGLLKDQAS
jgi:AcrR family transcriptional regulator